MVTVLKDKRYLGKGKISKERTRRVEQSVRFEHEPK